MAFASGAPTQLACVSIEVGMPAAYIAVAAQLAPPAITVVVVAMIAIAAIVAAGIVVVVIVVGRAYVNARPGNFENDLGDSGAVA
jgi:hypothetical protein